MPPIIRPMLASDIPLLANWMVQVPLWQRYNLTAEQAIANFQSAMQQGDWLLTADIDHPAQGFAWAVPRGAFARSPYLRLIGVQPGVSSTGVGSTLLHAIEERARAHATDLFLLVSDFNTDAQRFYIRHGYHQIGQIPAFVLPNISELIFRKTLK